jgi:hypothetical protein
MQKYNNAGYIVEGAEKFAVNVIKGNAYIEEQYGDDYYVKVVQNPFVQPEAIFDGMFAVSSFTSDEDRALEIIEMFTTDPEAKNIFQYGIADNGDNTAYANYRLVEVEDESGKFIVQRLNNSYMMDNGLTGNIYMGYPDPESGLPFDAWEYYKTTNLDSGIAPFLHLYVEESALDNILDSVLKRAALTDALNEIEIDYAKYEAAITILLLLTEALISTQSEKQTLNILWQKLKKLITKRNSASLFSLFLPPMLLQQFPNL